MATGMEMADLEEPYHMSVKYTRIGESGEDEVRIRIKWVEICGSDLEAYRGTKDPEFISITARLGTKWLVQWIKPEARSSASRWEIT